MKARILINFFLFLAFSNFSKADPDNIILRLVAVGLFCITAFWTGRFIYQAFRVVQRKDSR